MITLYVQDKTDELYLKEEKKCGFLRAAQVTYKSSATLNNVYSNLSNIFLQI